ncbi:hydrogenase iron-sulfur subunit [Comamonas granuli]|uniref:hydrogenase iron-sulfur subunit n=1 Tax=Comamonas granuli TaxID=290309 RepID=UPI0005A8DE92|nr:hydrogenase iron-sulfur subunit [Comamonas granuli]
MLLPGTAFAPEGSRIPAPPPPVSRSAALWRQLEHAFDAPFGAALNPLKHLGALGFMLLWLLVASGTILYIVLDTSAAGAYRSIAALADVPWMLGTVLRGVHRYATDAFLVVMLAHIVREWALGRYRHFRRISWLTGVPLVALAFVSGVGGFWLNWDRLGQYSVVATAEWIDALPFLASPLARNFLGAVSLNDRLFTLFVFIHIGVPLLLIFGLWFHIQRISLAQVFPPRALAGGSVLTLVALALALPVHSQGPADLSTVPTALALDWFVLFIHPLADATSANTVWGLLALAFGLLILPPLWPAPARPAVAVVHPEHCSGCARCFDDCPYSAITMVPHPNGKRGMRLAEVRADLCASCGICAGACPSSTPFRSAEHLVTGIDMPQWPVNDLRQQLVAQLRAMPGPRRLVVFGCDQGARVRTAADDVLHFGLVCAGMLPPSFVEYALRAGADGVLISGCRAGGCEFRLGQRWTAERLTGAREPHLRRSVPAERWRTAWCDPGDEQQLAAAVDELRRQCMAGAPLEEEKQ